MALTVTLIIIGAIFAAAVYAAFYIFNDTEPLPKPMPDTPEIEDEKKPGATIPVVIVTIVTALLFIAFYITKQILKP